MKSTGEMIEAAKSYAEDPSDATRQDKLKMSSENLCNICQTAVNTVRAPALFKKLAVLSKFACGTATQCIAASKACEDFNSNTNTQDQLLESCRDTADIIPRLIEAVRLNKLNPSMAMAQLNLLTTAEQLLEPTERYTKYYLVNYIYIYIYILWGEGGGGVLLNRY